MCNIQKVIKHQSYIWILISYFAFSPTVLTKVLTKIIQCLVEILVSSVLHFNDWNPKMISLKKFSSKLKDRTIHLSVAVKTKHKILTRRSIHFLLSS